MYSMSIIRLYNALISLPVAAALKNTHMNRSIKYVYVRHAAHLKSNLKHSLLVSGYGGLLGLHYIPLNISDL